MTIKSNLFFEHSPTNWKGLENLIHQAFLEMGYESCKGKTHQAVRGKIAIDVSAVKKSTPIPTTYLCECKYWSKPVNQNTVHAFRTVCNDLGAHYGLIISKKGFQRGAKQVALSTNIHLLDFNEFQSTFFREWQQGVFIELVKMRDNLLPLIKDLILDELIKPSLATTKYEIFHGYDNGYSQFFVLSEKQFPAKMYDPRGKADSLKIITVRSHREYYEIAKQGYKDALAQFNINPMHEILGV